MPSKRSGRTGPGPITGSLGLHRVAAQPWLLHMDLHDYMPLLLSERQRACDAAPVGLSRILPLLPHYGCEMMGSGSPRPEGSHRQSEVLGAPSLGGSTNISPNTKRSWKRITLGLPSDLSEQYMFIRSLVIMLLSFVPSLTHSFISQLRKKATKAQTQCSRP